MNQEFEYFPQNDQFGYSPLSPELPTKGHAKGYSTAAMWLGIASLFCTCCCCCIYLLAPILSVIAVVMACLARRDNGKRMPGAAVAGLVMAIIGAVLALAMLLFEIYMLMLPDSQLQEMIREWIEYTYGVSFEEFANTYNDFA